jgi:hypothetical protein
MSAEPPATDSPAVGRCPACFGAVPLAGGVLTEHDRSSMLIELDYVTGSHPVVVAGRCGGSGGPPHTAGPGAAVAYLAARYGRVRRAPGFATITVAAGR